MIFDYNFNSGHTEDNSSNGLDLTVGGGDLFTKGRYGLAVNTKMNNGTLTSPASDLADNIDAFTFVFSGDINKALPSAQSFLRRSDGLFYIFSSTAGAINVFNNSVSSVAAHTFSGYERTIIITKASGSSVPKLYVDGQYIKDFNSAQTFPTASGTSFQPLSGGVYNVYDCNSMALYSDEKTAEGVAAIHEEMVRRKTPFSSEQNFSIQPTIGVPTSGSAWNTKLVDGKVIDQNSENAYDGEMTTAIGSITGTGLISDKMPWGEPALRSIKGNNGHLNMGASTNINFTSGTFGYMGWFRPGNTGNEMFMSKAGSQFLQAPGTGQLQISLGSGAYTAGKLFQFEANQGILAGFLKTPDTEYGMLNGEELFNQATTAYGSGGTLRIGQYLATGFDISGLIGPQVAFRRFDSADEYFALARQEYLSKAKLPIIKDTLKDSFIHATAQGVGPLDGTPYYVESGTFKVNVEVINGVLRKIIECVTPGVLSLAVPDYAFGTWNYLVNKADASTMNIQFVSDGRDFSSANGYRIRLDSSETIFIQKVTSGTPSTQASMTSAITAGEWMNIKQERDNYFTTYIDGVEMAETSGTHPFQERTTTKNTFQLFDMDAGDKFTDDGLVLHKFGIV